jgi:SnoaL-like domain
MGTGKGLWNELETLSNKHDWTAVASLYTSDAVYSTPNFRNEGSEAIRAFLEAGVGVPRHQVRDIAGDRGGRHRRGRVDGPRHEHWATADPRRFGDPGDGQVGGVSGRDRLQDHGREDCRCP